MIRYEISTWLDHPRSSNEDYSWSEGVIERAWTFKTALRKLDEQRAVFGELNDHERLHSTITKGGREVYSEWATDA